MHIGQNASNEKTQCCGSQDVQASVVPLTFEQSSIEEKIARLRHALMETQQGNRFLARRNEALEKTIQSLRYHSHVDGKVVIGINDSFIPDYGSISASNSVNPLN